MPRLHRLGRPGNSRPAASTLVLAALILVTTAPALYGDDGDKKGQPDAEVAEASRAAQVRNFFLGAGVALVAHEAGHLALDVAFDGRPRVKGVSLAGIPFFAVAHRSDLSPRREYMISSAGFTVQHAVNEWILTSQPNLRDRSAPFAKGVVAFNVLTSLAYGSVAFAGAGPVERDTRGMADAVGLNERWIGAAVIAPAVLDAVRYARPRSRWACWASRGAKVTLALLVLRKTGSPDP